jgi:hypothetical protein
VKIVDAGEWYYAKDKRLYRCYLLKLSWMRKGHCSKQGGGAQRNLTGRYVDYVVSPTSRVQSGKRHKTLPENI